jgi:dipeptidyl aminopeptidase/acylaminoacyl peptidase
MASVKAAVAIVAGLAAGVGGCNAARAHSFQLKDVARIVTLSDPRISPDGRQIAVVLSRPDVKTDKPDQQIDLIAVASGTLRPLTRYRKGVHTPRWSPHGHRLAFIASAPAAPGSKSGSAAKPHAQVFVMPMDGGDALQVTHAPRGILSFAWSPGGGRIAYIAKNEPPNAAALKAHDNVFRVTDNNFMVHRAAARAELWVVPSAGGAARRLTDGAFSLDTDQQDPQPAPTWSPHGHSIAFVRFPDPFWALSFKSIIDTVPSAGGEPASLVPLQGSILVHYAPAGGALAFMRPRNGDENNGTAVYVAVGGTTFDATHALARNVDTYAWMPGGRGLLLTGEDGTRSVLWRQPLHGPARRLDLGGVDIVSPPSVATTGAIAFIGRTATHADELYVMASSVALPRRLTDVNGFLDALALGRSTTVRWRGPGGFHEDGVLTYPPQARPAHRDPLVLLIHGGPEGASTSAFSSLAQLLAAHGFLVFQPNYRGSTNLGDAYQHAIFRDTGEGPGRDVMAGLAAVERLGIVDRRRIGVSGWSYGGYMTDWLTSHYPRVWRAAVAGAALNDWVMDYTIAYYQQGDEYFFGGSPWTAKDYRIWRAQSPITYARRVKAPTLIMGDVFDPNVPLVNSYEWYHALRDNGVTVRFYAYPAHTHFPSDIDRQMDVMRRWVGWMRRYLK